MNFPLVTNNRPMYFIVTAWGLPDIPISTGTNNTRGLRNGIHQVEEGLEKRTSTTVRNLSENIIGYVVFMRLFECILRS